MRKNDVMEGKNPSTTGHVNKLHYGIDNQILEKRTEDVDKKYLILQF